MVTVYLLLGVSSLLFTSCFGCYGDCLPLVLGAMVTLPLVLGAMVTLPLVRGAMVTLPLVRVPW